jgi:hypothetical protein
MLEAGDAAGLPIIESAVRNDRTWEQSACGIAYRYLMDHGRLEEAQEYYRRGLKNADLVDAAMDERRITGNDHFDAHGLTADELLSLVAQLARQEGIVQAHLARKRVQHFADKPMFVMFLTLDKKRLKLKSSQQHLEMTGEIVEKIEFEHACYYLPRVKEYDALAKRVSKAPGSLIYQRSR